MKKVRAYLTLLILSLAGFFICPIAGRAAEVLDDDDFAIWHFNETSGITANDSGPRGNSLSWEFNPWGGGKIVPEREDGRWDIGINFSQKEELFSKTFSPVKDWEKGITFGLWLKTNLNSEDYARIFWLGNNLDYSGTPVNGLILGIKNGKAVLKLKNSGEWKEELEAGGPLINNNRWHLIAARLDISGNMAIFIDGQKAGETNFSQIIPAAGRLEIGRREDYFADYSKNNFSGIIDDAWLKSRNLTDEEILTIYQSDQPYKEEIADISLAPAAVMAYYPFDEGEGLLAHDYSGNNHDLNWGSNHWGGGEASPRWVAGRFGQAVNFKKVEDLFAGNFSPAPDLTNGLSAGVWIKTQESSPEGARFLMLGKNYQENNIVLSETNGLVKATVNFYDGSASGFNSPGFYFYRAYDLISNFQINDGEWHFVSLTYDPRAYHHSLKLYIDGQEEDSGFIPSSPPPFGPLKVGYREDYYSGNNFQGDVDDLFIMSSVLRADELRKIYESNEAFIWPLKTEKEPVIIVPGAIGSYLNKNEPGSPEVWPNISKMLLPGEDSYLYELSMNEIGYPTSASLTIPTDIFRKIYTEDFMSGLISELTDNDYKENENLFVFPYDWRYFIDWSAGNSPFALVKSLNDKIEEIKSKTGAQKVNIIAHSMGGLVAKQYIKFYSHDSVNKFIDIATPHLGAPKAAKILLYGDNLGFKIFGVTIMNETTIKNISQNFPSIYQLLPSRNYFDNANSDYISYIGDVYDYDGNGIKGNLNYDQSINFLKNSEKNNYLLNTNETLHNNLDNINPGDYNVAAYNIVGCGQPTLGRIYILNKEKSGGYEYALKYINGDGTVPLRSAEYLPSLKTYYNAGATHAYLPSLNGLKQLIASILDNKENSFDFPRYSNIRQDKNNCALNGTQVSYHSPIDLQVYDENNSHLLGPDENGDIELNIEGAAYDIIEGNKFVFLPAGYNYRIVGQATAAGTFNVRIQKIENGETITTAYFNEAPLDSINTETEINIKDGQQDFAMKIDQDGDQIFESSLPPSSILNKEESGDLEKPQTNIDIQGAKGDNSWYLSEIQITFTAQDNENGSGLLKTEYSLDSGQTWQNYGNPFTLNQDGIYLIKYKSTDRAGNIEEEKEEEIKIDRTKPNIDYIIPQANQEFLRSDKMEILYEMSDNLAGVAASSFKLFLDQREIGALTVDLFNYKLGEHYLTLEISDSAGNPASSSVAFIITANIDSTISDINRLYSEKQMNKKAKDYLAAEMKNIQKQIERSGQKQIKRWENLNKLVGRCAKIKGKKWCESKIKPNFNKIIYKLSNVHKKIIEKQLQLIIGQLELFLKKQWISSRGYEMIKEDIKLLIDKTREGGEII